MIVFKCYMKILRQNVTLVIIYLGIFFSVALVMQMAAGKVKTAFMQIPALILEW